MPLAVNDLIPKLQKITNDLERLQIVKRRTTELIDDVGTSINIEVGRLTKTLFGTDRSIVKALKKMEFQSQQKNFQRIRTEVSAQRPQIEALIMQTRPDLAKRGQRAVRNAIESEINKRILQQERQEKRSRPVVITFQGQQFTVEELDPKRIIEQRKLTGAEERALSKIVNNIQQLGSFAGKLTKDTNSEIQRIDEYTRQLIAISSRFASEQRRVRLEDIAPEVDTPETKATLNELLNKADEIKRIKRELVVLRKRSIKLQMVAKNVSRLADRVTSRADVETFLQVVTGVGALTALAFAVASATTVAGWIALPTLVAFGLLRVIKLARIFVGSS